LTVASTRLFQVSPPGTDTVTRRLLAMNTTPLRVKRRRSLHRKSSAVARHRYRPTLRNRTASRHDRRWVAPGGRRHRWHCRSRGRRRRHRRAMNRVRDPQRLRPHRRRQASRDPSGIVRRPEDHGLPSRRTRPRRVSQPDDRDTRRTNRGPATQAHQPATIDPATPLPSRRCQTTLLSSLEHLVAPSDRSEDTLCPVRDSRCWGS
jgi:hypothetical protein